MERGGTQWHALRSRVILDLMHASSNGVHDTNIVGNPPAGMPHVCVSGWPF